MRLTTGLALPLLALGLSAQAAQTTQLAQATFPFPWTLPYAWPQAAPTQALPPSTIPTLPAAPTAGSLPDPRLAALSAFAQPQTVDTLLRLAPLVTNPPFIEGMLKLASVAADPRTAEGFMKLAAALADPRTLETLSRLITAMSDPRLGEAVAVLADPKILSAVVTVTAVLGSAVAGPPGR